MQKPPIEAPATASPQVLDFIQIDLASARDRLNAVSSAEIRNAAEVFISHMEDVQYMLGWPALLIYTGKVRQNIEIELLKLLLAPGAAQRFIDDKPFRDAILKESHKNADEALRLGSNISDLLQESNLVVNEMISSTKVASRASRAILRAAITTAWSAFECLVRDLWVLTLNSKPSIVTERFKELAAMSTDPRMQEKQIPVGVLARYDFDIHNKLGDVFSPRFDFTCLAGMKRAYQAIFGKHCGSESALSLPDLVWLESARHVVVHRMGLADAAYLARTRAQLQVGNEVPLDSEIVLKSANSASSAGSTLIGIADRALNPDLAQTE